MDGVRDSHGTNVAGTIAMEKGNGVCGVGVAYNSLITGDIKICLTSLLLHHPPSIGMHRTTSNLYSWSYRYG